MKFVVRISIDRYHSQFLFPESDPVGMSSAPAEFSLSEALDKSAAVRADSVGVASVESLIIPAELWRKNPTRWVD